MCRFLWAGLLTFIAVVVLMGMTTAPGIAQDDADCWQLVEMRTSWQQYTGGEFFEMTAEQADRVVSSISLDDSWQWIEYRNPNYAGGNAAARAGWSPPPVRFCSMDSFIIDYTIENLAINDGTNNYAVIHWGPEGIYGRRGGGLTLAYNEASNAEQVEIQLHRGQSSLDDPATWRIYVQIGDLIAQVYYHYLPVEDLPANEPPSSSGCTDTTPSAGQNQAGTVPTPRQITAEGSAVYPQWSPDGQRILFTSRGDGGDSEIYVMAVDGSNRQQLTDNSSDEYEPAWSPGGRLIAYLSDQGGTNNIWMMVADGTSAHQITHSETPIRTPLWTNDASQIIYTSAEDIYSVDESGAPIWALQPDSYEYAQDIRPDSGDILFISDRDGANALYMMNANAANVRQLPQPDGNKWDVDFSPDGSKIVFQMNFDLHIMDVATGELTQLTANQRELGEMHPDWSPDGRQIVFAANKDGAPNLYIIDVPESITGATVRTSGKGDETTAPPAVDDTQADIDAIVQELLYPPRAIIAASELAAMSTDQQMVLDEFGPPDAFMRVALPNADGEWAQLDTWTYYDAYTAFTFLDGLFQRSEFVERPGNTEPTPYLPAHFLLGMPWQGVQDTFAGLTWTRLGDMEGLLADFDAPGEVWATDRLVLGFVDNQLVFVQALAFVQEGIG